jgi:hypothetical protein
MNKTDMISVQIQKSDSDFLELIAQDDKLEYEQLETSSFDGQSEIVTLVITLTPMVLGFLGKIITEQIRSERYVKVIYEGVQVQGLSEENATRLIQKMIEKKNETR